LSRSWGDVFACGAAELRAVDVEGTVADVVVVVVVVFDGDGDLDVYATVDASLERNESRLRRHSWAVTS
jgi:hypothetical protein